MQLIMEICEVAEKCTGVRESERWCYQEGINLSRMRAVVATADDIDGTERTIRGETDH